MTPLLLLSEERKRFCAAKPNILGGMGPWYHDDALKMVGSFSVVQCTFVAFVHEVNNGRGWLLVGRWGAAKGTPIDTNGAHTEASWSHPRVHGDAWFVEWC